MNNNFATSPFIERSDRLQADIHDFAQRLSTASHIAHVATNPALGGTELEDVWPLSDETAIEQRLTGMAFTPRRAGGIAVASQRLASPVPEAFMGDKFYDDTLEQAYGANRIRQAFVSDLAKWADKMDQAGWPFLVRLTVADSRRTEVSTYEDNEATRAYFDMLATGGRLDERATADGEAYGRIGERIVVDEAAFVLSLLPPRQV